MLILSAVTTLGCSLCEASEPYVVTVRLDELHSTDRSEQFRVVGTCNVISDSSGGDSAYTLNKFRVIIEKDSVEYGIHQVVGKYDFDVEIKTSKESTLVAPLWNGKWIVGPYSIPPSARLFTHKDVVYAVLFDGTRCKLLEYHSKESIFKQLSKVPEEIHVPLQDLHRHSFAVDDVGWSCALCRCADFFSATCAKLSFSGLVTSDDIYKCWKSSRYRPV